MKAVIFDMFETLVTLYSVPQYFGRNIAADLGADIEAFYPLWHETEEARSKGKMSLEEAKAIRASVLMPFFDVVLLSCELGMQKPEREIFEKCLADLAVTPEECLYVGDGGSLELETARSFGMKTLQAGWFIKNHQDNWKKEGFDTAEEPEEVLRKVR